MAADVAELGYIESNPKQDGRNMIMVIGPHKKKAEAKAEQRKRHPDEVDGIDGDHGIDGIDGDHGVDGGDSGTDITAGIPAEETAQA
jgi:translation initiation factor IF-3